MCSEKALIYLSPYISYDVLFITMQLLIIESCIVFLHGLTIEQATLLYPFPLALQPYKVPIHNPTRWTTLRAVTAKTKSLFNNEHPHSLLFLCYSFPHEHSIEWVYSYKQVHTCIICMYMYIQIEVTRTKLITFHLLMKSVLAEHTGNIPTYILGKLFISEFLLFEECIKSSI